MGEWQRFTAVEYAKPTELPEEMAQRTSSSIDLARDLLIASGNRVRHILGLEGTPMLWTGDKVQFQNVAGLLLLAPRLELEIAPKFLGDTLGWREDFFLLATLSHHGRLLDREGLNSSSRQTSDLATLIGRCFVEMYNHNRRHPLRAYRRLMQTEYSIEGDFEPEELSVPSEEGFVQQVTSFTRENPYNAVIGAAAMKLAPVVPDVETRVRLDRVAQHLPRQAIPARLRNQRLPSRSRSWQPTYDLALDILRGFGGTYDPKNLLAPGFVMRTWQIWEALVSLSLRLGFGASRISIQSQHRLGTRYSNGRASSLNVVPDCVLSIVTDSGTRYALVDAKYKGNVNRGALTISNADIYEALAFSHATGVKDIVLVYPTMVEGVQSSQERAGHAAEFTRIRIGDTEIRGVEAGVCGISKSGGLRRFVSALRSEILATRPESNFAEP